MNVKQPLPSEPAPRSVLGIPANAGIQWSPKSAYFRLRAPTFGGASTTFWMLACASMTVIKLTGQQ